MVTLYTLGKKSALFCYVLVGAFEKIATATEIYEKFCFALCAAWHGFHTYNFLPTPLGHNHDQVPVLLIAAKQLLYAILLLKY